MPVIGGFQCLDGALAAGVARSALLGQFRFEAAELVHMPVIGGHGLDILAPEPSELAAVSKDQIQRA